MKRTLIKIAVQSTAILLVYSILLRLLANTNIVAGIFSPARISRGTIPF